LTARRRPDSNKVLLATKGRLEQSNRRLALVVSNSNLMRIFQITRFDELFEIYPSLGAAVQRHGNVEALKGRAGRG
jgi:anti-anti-sigma regulatory factor